MKKIYNIIPVAKPRMTRRDKWAKRPVVLKYFAFCDEVREKKIALPEPPYKIIFHMPMPASWCKKKKQEHAGKPHLCRPDRDNLEKALNDAVCGEDSHLWSAWTEKRWSYTGKIEIVDMQNNLK